MKNKNHILQFEKLSQFDSLVHGFSTRFFGSMRPSHEGYKESLNKFTTALGVDTQKIVRMDQVHSNTIAWVSQEDGGQTIAKTDGLLTQDKDIFLGVITADCVPLLFYDPKKQIVAAVHAGWRGLVSEIIKRTVSNLVAKGSNPQDLIVGIGPSIRACCYDIANEHVEKLLAQFPDWKPFIVERAGKFFLDLPAVADYQLRCGGILESHIEDGDYCTFEHEDVYSYRKEGKDFGEMMGIIGILK